jgi:hypothetical protein
MTGVCVMLELSALERRILELYYIRYNMYGFPQPDALSVTSRSNTGSGRITKLFHEGQLDSPDGELFLGSYSYLEMEGMDYGANFSVDISEKKVSSVEILCVGNIIWDGLERSWRILNPETGEDYLGE